MGRAGRGLPNHQIAGLFLLAGSAVFALGITIAETLYPAYSVSHDFLADLGGGPSAIVFNSSITFFGIALIAAGVFLFRAFRDLPLTVALVLAGIGAIGFGLVPATDNLAPETYRNLAIHTGFALAAYFFAALAAILAVRVVRSPFGYISVALGIVSLVALGLLGTDQYGILGRGGMERMVVWPLLLWGVAVGGSLLTIRSLEKKGVAPAGPVQT